MARVDLAAEGIVTVDRSDEVRSYHYSDGETVATAKPEMLGYYLRMMLPPMSFWWGVWEEAPGISIRYDEGGWRRRRHAIVDVDRPSLLALFRQALRRCGREDGWTRELGAAIMQARGSRRTDLYLTTDDAKHFAQDLLEMGYRDLAIEVDAWAYVPEARKLEDEAAALRERAEQLTGLVL